MLFRNTQPGLDAMLESETVRVAVLDSPQLEQLRSFRPKHLEVAQHSRRPVIFTDLVANLRTEYRDIERNVDSANEAAVS